MKQTKKQSAKQIVVKKKDYQEITIDITRDGLRNLTEALDYFNSIGLNNNDIIEITIVGILQNTVLKFKIIPSEISTQQIQGIYKQIQDIYKKTKKNLL